MKLSLSKCPRLTLKRLKLGLPALPKLARPRLSLPLVRGGSEGARFYVGAAAFVLIALAALGWMVVWPILQPPQPVAAVNAETAEADAKTASQIVALKKPETSTDAASKSAREAESPPNPKEVEARPIMNAAAPASSSATPSEVEDLVRRLQNLQERVAAGDSDSYAEMPHLLRHIAQRLLAQPREVWSQKPNARALVLFLLSGGQSVLGRKILSARSLATAEEGLAKGAVAYLEGVDCAERDAFLELDPRALDAALGAQVAFVQATLLASSDRQRAIAQLDLARLLAPGGLVEEAALRREVGLLSESGDFDKFAALARQYWSRFRHSPYAENFLRQFVGSVARVSILIKVEQWEQIDEFIDSLAVEKRRAVYLVMAQTAAVAGNTTFADLAAQRALGLLAPDSAERQRALLYRAAAQVAGADAAQSPTLLRDVDREKLPAADQPLYAAIEMVSSRIFGAPEKDFVAPPPGAGDLPGGELTRAEAGLRAADAALANARQSMERPSR